MVSRKIDAHFNWLDTNHTVYRRTSETMQERFMEDTHETKHV